MGAEIAEIRRPAMEPTVVGITSTGRPARVPRRANERQAEPCRASRVAQIVGELERETRRRDQRLRRALACADLVAITAALTLAVGLASSDALQPLGLLLLPVIVIAAKLLGLYDADVQRIRKTTADELPRLAQLGVLLVLGMWLADQALIAAPAGKAQALATGAIFVLVALLGRWVARLLANRGQDRERCLFLGDAASYRRLATIFARHQLSSDLVGRASVQPLFDAAWTSPGGPAEVLGELTASVRAHRIIIGPPAIANGATFELVESARRAGTRVSLLPDMLEVVGSSVDFDDLFGVTLLGVRHSQLNRSSRFVKRGFDLAGATLLLLAAAPLMAVIAAAIRLDSKGPVLFRQTRIGRDGVPFAIRKFRTMVAGADALKDGLRGHNEAAGLFKMIDDPRMTTIGRLLRRSSLDELPQLLNVIGGSMSLVGPRPLVADEDGRIHGTHRGRLRLTPGMTGPWQIAGSARVPLEDMVKLDHLYVSNWTLWGDVKILLRTVPFVLGSRGM